MVRFRSCITELQMLGLIDVTISRRLKANAETVFLQSG
jgi:hypothetical protein